MSYLVRLGAVVCFGLIPSLASAQSAGETIDRETINKIKEEGMERSMVMDTISYLTDVHGPRLTASPPTKTAGDWTLELFNSWGIENAWLEPWGPFGKGWTLENCEVDMVAPTYAPLIAHVKAWSPSTTVKVKGVPIYMDVQSEEDLEKYRGKLGKAIVLISPPRELEAHFEPEAIRKTQEELLRLANAAPPSERRGGRGARFGRGATFTPPAADGAATPAPATPAAPASGDAPQPPAAATAATAQPTPPPTDPRAAMRMQAAKWDLAYAEGAAVILEPGRGDGGNVFVASVTMPRISDDRGAQGNPFSRGPRPWAAEATNVIPQAVMAAEHYNRLVRMIERGAAPELEIDIAASFHDGEPNTFNVVAEIPGSDLKDEIVMLGAHFDSWQAGTGATDNAVGCGVVMEAVRILKAIGVQPRRTIRLALWTGEEQGLLGSRAYVNEHFGQAVVADGEDRRSGATYEVTPDYEKISAYYNLDNGTGKIRGIYLQGNEQLRSIFRTWLEPFEDMDATTITAGNTGGTDHQSFDGIGIPGFQFIQDEVEYDTRTHHSSMDVYERIQEDDVKQASVIMASFVYLTAMRDEKLPRKPLRGELKLKEVETQVEEETIAAESPATTEAPAAAATPAEAVNQPQ